MMITNVEKKGIHALLITWLSLKYKNINNILLPHYKDYSTEHPQSFTLWLKA